MQATDALQACDFHVRVALVALRLKIPVAQAQAALDVAQGSVRQALEQLEAT